MKKEDKEFAFASSIAGGFVAGGSLLTYQILLKNGLIFAIFWAIFISIILFSIVKKPLFKKNKK